MQHVGSEGERSRGRRLRRVSSPIRPSSALRRTGRAAAGPYVPARVPRFRGHLSAWVVRPVEKDGVDVQHHIQTPYSDEFGREAVELVRSSGKTIREVAQNLGWSSEEDLSQRRGRRAVSVVPEPLENSPLALPARLRDLGYCTLWLER
jgi:hypothetical protein